MADEHLLSRREFTIESVLAILAAVTITVTGCDGGYEMGPSPPPGDREGVVSSNHGHRAIVTAVQLNSNSSVTIDMRYQASHNHTLTLTTGELGSIAENARMVKTSSTDDGHNHTVTFN
jgi:hypothetical protein